MGLNINYEEERDGLEVFLQGIEIDSEQAEKEMLRKSGDKVKEFVVAELNKHRRTLEVRYKGRPAMADDVKRTLRTSKWGDKYVRVSGGKMTGTLWHIVNDGTLHSRGLHFLDRAMKQMDDSIDEMWNETMR